MTGDPQLKNGFTKIANEILEALARIRIPGEQRQVLDVVIRKTDGFKKKWDVISNSQFCKDTGLKKQHVNRAIKELVIKNIVIKKDYGKIPSYCFNKQYTKWKLSPKKVTVTKKGSHPPKSVTKKGSHKRKVFTKENNTVVTPLTEKLKQIVASQKNIKIDGHKLNGWAKSIRLMVDRDGISQERISTALEWYETHVGEPYVVVIESGKSLREKFIRLEDAMNRSSTSEDDLPTYSEAEKTRQYLNNLFSE